MKLLVITFCCVFSGVFLTSAQSSQNTGGGNISSPSGNVSYSIGQTFYEPITSASGSVMLGVQQSYEITETLGVEITEINLNLNIYPNPTSDILYFKIGFEDYKKYRYEFFDGNGKLLTGKPVNESQTSIRIASYPAASYLLKVTKHGKIVKVFKVLKKDK